MQSKNKKAPTKAEKDHIVRVKNLPCSVCDQAGPSECHEIKQGQWETSVALCPSCHMDEKYGLHGRKQMWVLQKLDELDALAITIRRLFWN